MLSTLYTLVEQVIEERSFPIQRVPTEHEQESSAYAFRESLRNYGIKFRHL